MKYTKKQIAEAIKYWEKALVESKDDETPVISCISDFLKICKERGIDVKKKKAYKQGKIVDAEIAVEDYEIKSREGKEVAHAGDLVVNDGDDTFYAVPKAKIKDFYELKTASLQQVTSINGRKSAKSLNTTSRHLMLMSKCNGKMFHCMLHPGILLCAMTKTAKTSHQLSQRCSMTRHCGSIADAFIKNGQSLKNKSSGFCFYS